MDIKDATDEELLIELISRNGLLEAPLSRTMHEVEVLIGIGKSNHCYITFAKCDVYALAWPFIESKQDELTKGGWNDTKDRRETEYIRADLMPRWRPIAELPDEWRDGRVVIFRGRGVIWGATSTSYIGDKEEFLDFGGKSMPD